MWCMLQGITMSVNPYGGWQAAQLDDCAIYYSESLWITKSYSRTMDKWPSHHAFLHILPCNVTALSILLCPPTWKYPLQNHPAMSKQVQLSGVLATTAQFMIFHVTMPDSLSPDFPSSVCVPPLTQSDSEGPTRFKWPCEISDSRHRIYRFKWCGSWPAKQSVLYSFRLEDIPPKHSLYNSWIFGAGNGWYFC